MIDDRILEETELRSISEAPPKPKRILNPPKRMNSSWVLYFKERLAVSTISQACLSEQNAEMSILRYFIGPSCGGTQGCRFAH